MHEAKVRCLCAAENNLLVDNRVHHPIGSPGLFARDRSQMQDFKRGFSLEKSTLFGEDLRLKYFTPLSRHGIV